MIRTKAFGKKALRVEYQAQQYVLYFVRRSLTTFSSSDVGFGFNGTGNKTPTNMSVLRQPLLTLYYMIRYLANPKLIKA